MSEFHLFGSAVRRQFEAMSIDRLFEVDGDGLWEAYLAAFPAGSNPMFRQRTEHDCSCCRHFIRSTGNVVAFQNGALTSIWDVQGLPPHYQAVADAMSALVKSRAIENVFLTRFAKHGTESNPELSQDGIVTTWHHFAVSVPKAHQHPNPAEAAGRLRTNQQTLFRAVTELKPEAIKEVVDLISSGSLYRGEEHLRVVEEFQRFQDAWLAKPVSDRDLCWTECGNDRLAHFRNSVIGTLVQDLSNGVELEAAVRSFESKVAPQNYRRSKALITPKMIESALATLDSLGLRDAIQRRHARLSDVSVNSVLFVDRAVRPKMKDGLAALLSPEVRQNLKPASGQEIPATEFFAEILPQCTALDLFFENAHVGNLMSLTAPAVADSGRLFQWPNDFAWSYAGNVTDSIKERVKRAGGQVEGIAMRVSLAWYNYDDLDLHCRDAQGTHIFFRNKFNVLDVDMNAGSGTTREPVENMRWARPTNGTYDFRVHNYSKRESAGAGFEIEIEGKAGINTLRYDRSIAHGEEVKVAVITCQGGEIVSIAAANGMELGARSTERWGLTTQAFHRVNSIVLSPNHWASAQGNRHWFFLLEGAHNPEPTRGFYNEFLNGSLLPHRKVFEVLADKTKIPPDGEQLSGVGFSSTLPAKVTVKAMGPNLSRNLTIVF